MDDQLLRARAVLEQEDCTCVLCLNGSVYKSTQRGILPLLAFLDSGTDFRGCFAADKVVGKGAAFLYCLLGAKAVYAPVISRSAMAVLTEHGITVQYDTLTDAICNRQGDGFCPMETATQSISSPAEALPVLRRTLKALQEKKA